MVEERIVGEIGQGLLVLLGVSKNNTKADADYLAEKVAGLRVFEDRDGKMNRAVADAGGAVLAVSQFTLYEDVLVASDLPLTTPQGRNALARSTISRPTLKL